MAALQHDARGFLVGERLISGVDLIGRDTTEILKILKGATALKPRDSNRDRVSRDRLGHAVNDHAVDAALRQSLSPRGTPNRRPLPTVDVGAPSGSQSPIPPTQEPSNSPSPRRENGQANGQNNQGSDQGSDQDQSPDSSSPDGRQNNGRRRNSRGQFEGDGSGGLINGIKNAIRSGFSLGNADTQNIDPTVDAVRELGTLMSPLAKVGKTMFKGAAWLFRRKKKRDEPSTQEQRQQSRIEKLLKRIAGSRVGAAARSGSNLLGGIGGGLSSLFGMGGNLLSGLAPLLMRALVPALGLTAAFKFGEWIGGKIYDAIAPKLGEAIDWSVDAYKTTVAKTSEGIEAGVEIYKIAVQNMADNMEKTANGAKRIWETGKGVYQQARSNMADKMMAVDEAMNSNTKPTNLTKSASENQMMVYNAFKNSGMSDAQAKAMTAEVGRENDYNDKNLYGTHTDDKNHVTNQGMFSWQKDRRTKLVSFMQKRGLVDEGGNFKKGQESLNAQAEFAKAEIDSGQYEKTRQFFAANPNAKPEDAAQILGHDYVGWRMDDPRYAANGNARRRGHLANLEKQLSRTDVSKVTAELPTMPTVNSMVNAPLDFLNGGVASTASTKVFAPTIPMAAPKLLARAMPEIPKQKQQVSTQGQKPMQVSVVGGNEAIGQNLSDRHLAHAVTGGLGMDALRHG